MTPITGSKTRKAAALSAASSEAVSSLPCALILTRDDPAHATGGVETFSKLLLRVFPGSELLAYAGAAGPRLLCNEARDARAIVPRLEARVAELRPDVVIANGAAASALDAPRAQALGVPVITVYHGTYGGLGRAIAPVAWMRGLVARTYGAFIERKAGAGRAAVVAVSDGVAAQVQELYGVTPRVIENCASLDGRKFHSRSAARERMGFADRARIVLYVGRAERSKGFDLVVALARNRPDLVVIAAGVTARHGLPANLRAVGVLTPEQLAENYAAADVVALPSRYEGCPFALLDAIRADRPIVTFATGCFPEPGLFPFGIVLPKLEQESFVAAVATVLAEREAFSPRAATKGRFTFARFMREWRALVKEVVGDTEDSD